MLVKRQNIEVNCMQKTHLERCVLKYFLSVTGHNYWL